jgi:WASH complex subunit strumpellin
LKAYMPVLNKLARLFPPCLDVIMRIGQMQLLRTKICYELNNAAKFDSKQLFHALATFNDALISQVNAHFEDPANAYPDEDNPLLYELNPYLECVGLSEPMKKIYITANKFEQISFFMSMMILAHLAKLPSVKLTGIEFTLNLTKI